MRLFHPQIDIFCCTADAIMRISQTASGHGIMPFV